MKAEDAVILKAIQEAYNRPDLEVEYVSEQDRVVFKAGIKEVVDSVNLILKLPDIAKENIIYLWQAKLKEWGINIS